MAKKIHMYSQTISITCHKLLSTYVNTSEDTRYSADIRIIEHAQLTQLNVNDCQAHVANTTYTFLTYQCLLTSVSMKTTLPPL